MTSQPSPASWLASKPAMLAREMAGLTEAAKAELNWTWRGWWARPAQLAPGGDWRTWLFMAGRGAGKTRAGAEWVRSCVEGATTEAPGRYRRIALVAETLDQARDVMIFGDSGIMACSPPDRRPEWQATRRRLVWPNGAEAVTFSASSPEMLRGPQFDAAWADELGKWRKGSQAWDMLQFALRLGDAPRAVVTTTPRRSALLEEVLGAPGMVTTQAPTAANAENLAPGFLDAVEARYGGTALGRQELDGLMPGEVEGALWTRAVLERARAGIVLPSRIVVAVDPPVTSGEGADACGIVVAGADHSGHVRDWRAVVMADETLEGASPVAWAEHVVRTARKHGADRIVAEVNQGGELVETLIRQVDPLIPVKSVRASRSKIARAEPVAALYEQGRVTHADRFDALEDQLCAMTRERYEGPGSPDRADALVWALTDLMIRPSLRHGPARLRTL
ncbi:MAG: DNA-packaging protein [Rubricella sp.]